MLKTFVNEDKLIVEKIRQGIKNNDGYCICSLLKNEDTKCQCKEFREQQTEGSCHCNLYYKKLVNESEENDNEITN